MQRINAYLCLLLSFGVFFLIACNQSATSEKKENDTASTVASNDASTLPAYDPAMDPLTVGPQFSKKLQDTLNIKMYEFTVKPGESWSLHTHPDHTVYVLEGGTMALYIREKGNQDTITFPTGASLISGPISDSGRNVGNTTIKMLVQDIYRPRSR